jgi:hypothetical protein
MFRAALVVVGLLSVAGTLVPNTAEAVPGQAALSPQSYDLDLVASPLWGGSHVRVFVGGLTPGTRFAVFTSVGAPANVPWCPPWLHGGCVELGARTHLLGHGVADSGGMGIVRVRLPAALAGSDVGLQAVDAAGRTSPPVWDRVLDPQLQDSDGDELTDYAERYVYATNPFEADVDGDGLLDGDEIQWGSDPWSSDTDGDGVWDGEEVAQGTDPTLYDFGPYDLDADGDGLSDGEEDDLGTDPLSPDTDGDGYSDYDEAWGYAGSDPTEYDTDPFSTDSDGDGLMDGDELQIGTDPDNWDTDGDGFGDLEELYGYSGGDPLQYDDVFSLDSDYDGLSDGDEASYGTDPYSADSDADGWSDGDEVYQYGTDPTSPASTP